MGNFGQVRTSWDKFGQEMGKKGRKNKKREKISVVTEEEKEEEEKVGSRIRRRLSANQKPLFECI